MYDLFLAVYYGAYSCADNGSSTTNMSRLSFSNKHSVSRRGGKTKVKKLTIKALKRAPKLPPTFEEESWTLLRSALDAIFQEKPIQTSREDLYRTAEDVCMHKMSARLYDRLKTEFERETSEIMKRLSGVLGDIVASGGDEEAFLQQFESMWSKHCQHSAAIRSIFLYLDRTYILQNCSEGMRSIWEMVVSLFRGSLAGAPDVEKYLVDSMLALIRGERKGESVNRTLMRRISQVLSTLGIYHSLFQQTFLEHSGTFYGEEGLRCMSHMTVPDYLAHVSKRLHEEVDRVSTYLDPSSRQSLVHSVEEQLLGKHTKTIIEKGFSSLLDQNRVEDLCLMHTLFTRVDGVDLERKAFGVYIENAGGKIVNSPHRDKAMVQSLLDFKHRLDRILAAAFQGDETFAHTLKGAFERFINSRANTPAEMIAKYIDERLRTGRVDLPKASLPSSSSDSMLGPSPKDAKPFSVGASEEIDMETLLDRIMVLFRYINGKDVFEAFYKKDLAKRLLLNKSASQEMEKSMVSKLKTECGAAFTTKLEGMFKDMTLSTETMQNFTRSKYSEEYSKSQTESGSPCEMYVHVLRTGFWPTYPPLDMSLPLAVAEGRRVFETFYNENYQGRKLYWQHSLGTCVVKAQFGRKRHEFNVSLFQASVLLLFHGHKEGDRMSYGDILSRVKLTPAELKRTLQSLACGKIRPLKKRPKGKEVADSDSFIVAHDFKNSRFKLKINQIQIKETKAENKETNEKVFRDRLHAVDAILVRIMKTRKTMSHSDLMSETMSQLKFPAQGSDIKKRIESLIDREYLEREENNPQQYRYLA